MMSLSELKRRLNNIIQVGEVSETKSKEGKALARVILDNDGENKRVTTFLPVLSLSNSFGKVWFPIRVKEQVLVISPFGNANRGFIIRSIFNKGCKEPSGANEHTAVMEFEDGTKISYDSKANELKVDAVKTVNIICVDAVVKASNSVNVETKTAYLKAVNTTIESETLVKGSLTVMGLFSALGGMKVVPAAGITVGAEFDCDISTTKTIHADGDISTDGTITDSMGDLTNHTNGGYGRN